MVGGGCGRRVSDVRLSVKDRLRRWRTVVLLCFLITCSAMDVWDEKAIQNIKRRKKKKKKEARPNTDRLENLL